MGSVITVPDLISTGWHPLVEPSPLTDEPKLKVYLAARYSRKNEIKEKADELEGLGITVTSRWLDEVEPSESGCLDGLTDSYIQKVAAQDVEDIDICDVLVLFSEDPKVPHVRGGRHFETGYAYGKGIPVIVCGPVENVFHRLSRVIVVDSWDELKANLRFLGKVKLI